MKKFAINSLSITLLGSLLTFVTAPEVKAATSCSTNASFTESVNATTGLMVTRFIVTTKTSDGACTFVVPSGITSVRVLSVSGGGGGGWDGGGGGGGGGVNKYDNFAVTPGASIAVAIGGGGAAATSSSTTGGNGGISSFGGNYASGGGGGGGKLTNGNSNGTGNGGGAGHTNNNTTSRIGGTATQNAANINFEKNGGNSIGDYAGGGGGAASVGGAATTSLAGSGGSGFYSTLEGAGATYGGGGGGGTWKAATATSGGSGGGGSGATQDLSAGQGTDNAGGGGGGGGRADVNRTPGRGGSGVVLVSYKASYTCNTSTTSSGGYTTVVIANTTNQVSNCTTTWSTPSGITTAEVLLIAGGGGGGGMYVAGGGGAGGYIYNATQAVSGTISIQVGGGGKGGETLNNTLTNIGNSGFDGSNTTFSTLSAVGGGGGGAYNIWVDGRSGGSGGGSAVLSDPTVGAIGSATAGQGNVGGLGAWITGSNPGGGGGGKGSSGSSGTSSTGGAGGSGVSNPISGVSVSATSITTVAGGGGGGSDSSSGGSGGSSIGGSGGSVNSAGTSGVANTGSGGGGAGGGSNSNLRAGGNGSAGLVVIKYPNTLNVTFNSQGGSSVTGTTVLTNATLSAPSSPTKAGYNFSGWSLSSNGSVVTFPFTHGQTSDFTLYAIWARNSSCLATTTTSGGATIVTINAGIQTISCTTTWSVPAGVTKVESLIVGGGGSGAYYYGGGGGGGAITTGIYSVSGGDSISLTVGGGGASKSGSTFTKQDGSAGSASSVTIGSSTYSASGGNGGIGCSYTGAGVTFTCNSTNIGGTGGGATSGSGGIGNYSTGLFAEFSNGTSGEASTITGSSTTYGSGGDGGGATNNGANGASDSGAGGAGSGGYYNVTLTSGAGAAGVVIFRYSDPAPTISGSFTLTNVRTVGQTIGINSNTILITGRSTGATYQWQKATTGAYSDIAGATSSTYLIQSGDNGSTLKLVITYSNSGGSVSTSAISSSIIFAAPTIGGASLSGASAFGNTLTVTETNTSGSGTTLSYQWYRSSSQSGTYNAIAGATSNTYLTSSNDVNYWVKATITITNSGGSASATSSPLQISSIQLNTPNAPTGTAVGNSTSSINVVFTSVSNATSYTARVYQSDGTTLVNTITNFTSGSNITGLSANTGYKVTITAIGDGTNYSNSSASSASALITTNASAVAPTIDTQPVASVSKSAGQSITLTVSSSASDSGTLTYQWQKNGFSISGATSATYTFTSAAGDSGTYTVVVTNTKNGTSATTTSNSTEVSVATAPTITTPSGTGLTGTYNSTYTLNINATGTSLNYSVANGTLPTGLTLNSNTGAITGTPSLTGTSAITISVTDANGATVSTSSFTITINKANQSALSITSTSGLVGSALTLTTSGGSTAGTITFAVSNGTATGCQIISGSLSTSTGGSCLVTATMAGDNNYNAISSTQTTITFAAVQLVTPNAPTGTAVGNSTSSINVVFTSVSNATSYTARVYQSDGTTLVNTITNFTSGSNITGLSANTGYKVTITAIGDGTTYTNSSGSPLSGLITTNTGAANPIISSHPQSATRSTGQSVTFSVTASRSDLGSLTYQWLKNGTAISGATNATLIISSISSGDAGDYSVVVTNTLNGTTASTTSNIATLIFQQFYSATFDANGGTYSDNSTTKTAASILAGQDAFGFKPSNPTRVNYDFSGWAENSNPTLVISSFALNADTTFIAVWVFRGGTLRIIASDISGNFGTAFSDPTYTSQGLASGEVIGSVSYKYKGLGYTRYGLSTVKPTAVGTYSIIPFGLTLSVGNQSNYQIIYESGTLTIAGSSSKEITNISVKSTNVKYSNSELITSFSKNTNAYSVYVNDDTSAVVIRLTRGAGSLIQGTIKVNNSGLRKLTFINNLANSGPVPVPTNENTVSIQIKATDGSFLDYTISILRDQTTKSTTGGVATPTPMASPIPATQVSFSSVKFIVNGNQVNISPSFSVNTSSYTASFSVNQSATQMQVAFTSPGITLRLQINDSIFKTIPATGSSTTIPLIKGSNTAILRVLSADGSLTDYTFNLTRAMS